MAKKTDLKYYEGIGRRKSAVVRARLYITDKKGIDVRGAKIVVGQHMMNGIDVYSYFSQETQKYMYKKPFDLTGSYDRFAVSLVSRGGGIEGQLDASLLAVSRALEKVDASYRPILKKENLLSRDSRIRERRMPGTGGKSRRQKQSPKR